MTGDLTLFLWYYNADIVVLWIIHYCRVACYSICKGFSSSLSFLPLNNIAVLWFLDTTSNKMRSDYIFFYKECILIELYVWCLFGWVKWPFFPLISSQKYVCIRKGKSIGNFNNNLIFEFAAKHLIQNGYCFFACKVLIKSR